VKGFTIFVAVCLVVMIGFAIWFPATHESKSEKIARLEQRVDDLEQRVAVLEQK
jgi:hypothetical protein